MADQPLSRSSSRTPSIRDSDNPSSTQHPSTSAPAPAPLALAADNSIPASTTPNAKRDASYSSRASTATRSNLSGNLSGYHSLHSSRAPSSATSPHSSRDPSPAYRHTSASNAMSTPRVRKNSLDISPPRSQTAASTTATNTPSATAIQRALSRESAPQLQPTSVTTSNSTPAEPNSRVARSTKPSGAAQGKDGPSWPVSPRLRSPPSSSPRRSSARGSKRQDEAMTMDGTVRRRSPDAVTDVTNLPVAQPGAAKVSVSRSLTSSAPYLETVQESSVPPTPLEDSSRESSRERKHEYFSFDPSMNEPRPVTARRESVDSLEQLTPKASNANGKSVKKAENTAADCETAVKSKLLLKDSPTKSDVKTVAEPVSKNMTVETETVSSIPQATLAPTDRSISGKNELGGTLRVKASTETIRPRKERKKATKKAPSVNAGSSSTRADIFEDRVKNAMDEATSDDSDETFVYESNPPDPPPGRSRHHSRTPSGASLSSMPDRTVMRSIANAIEHQRTVPKSRSMKFSSNASNYGTADEDHDNNGTVRASHRNGHSAIQQHFRGTSRTNTAQHLAADDEANVVPLSKTKSLTAVGGRGSYAARLAAQNLRHSSTVKRNDGYVSLDMEAEGGDDERTPLMMSGTVRMPRNNNRSLRGRPRGYEPQYFLRRQERRSLWSRFAGCLLILSTLSILIFGVVCFLFAMSKPLSKVAITDLRSIIASEQELMLDVVIQAFNPNLVPITVMELDVNMFARSKYVGSERWWREHGQPPPGDDERQAPSPVQQQTKRDVLTRRQLMVKSTSSSGPDRIRLDDPVSKEPSHGQTMLLGTILHFDNPLTFDGSFWRRQSQYSRGSIRLSKPGNHTEAGGTERWEHVLKHDFDLIVRGVLKYQIPLGGRTVNVPINGEKSVKGNGSEDDDDDDGDGTSGGEYEWASKSISS